MDEKRKFSRVAFTVKALVDCAGGKFEGEVTNLSLKGMFIHGLTGLKPGEKLNAELKLIGGTSELSLKLSGQVVRAAPDGVAVQLEPMDLDSFIHLRNIVAYNSGDADLIDREFLDHIKHLGGNANHARN